MKNEPGYSICLSKEDFEIKIKSHYHGDKGTLFSTPCVGVRTIWQCACGYRASCNQIVNFSIADIINI